MIYASSIQTEGFLRLYQIIGQSEVTPDEAKRNKEIRRDNRSGKHKLKVGPCTPRPGIPAIVPWSKSKLWDAVKKREFPEPVKLSPGTTAWTVESVREFLASKRNNILT